MKTTLSLLLVSLVALSCKSAKDPSTWECQDDGACGEKQICSKKTHECLDVQCVTSSDCGLSNFCDTSQWRCKAGCQTTDDCRAGESCNSVTATCQAYGCRSTQLDCNYGEFCDTNTGTCTKADGAYCESCNATGRNTCGSGAYCIHFVGEPAYCYVGCNPNAADPCPRGFECIDDGTEWICEADCDWALENGYL